MPAPTLRAITLTNYGSPRRLGRTTAAEKPSLRTFLSHPRAMMSATRTHVRRETLVTWILALATFGVLTSIAVACRRAHLEAKAAFGDGLQGSAERPLTAVAASPSPRLFVVSREGRRG